MKMSYNGYEPKMRKIILLLKNWEIIDFNINENPHYMCHYNIHI